MLKISPQIRSLNGGIMYGRSGEIVAFLEKCIDMYCTHKTCQKCKAPRMIVAKNPRYKLYWLGNENGTGDAGIFIEQIK